MVLLRLNTAVGGLQLVKQRGLLHYLAMSRWDDFAEKAARGTALASRARPFALQSLGLALLMGLVAVFVARAITGPTGVLAWREYHAERQRLEAAADKAEQTRKMLERDVALLDPNGVNPDIADELARRNLNLARPDEVIVLLPAEPAPAR
jgi:cell division protein FtsB